MEAREILVANTKTQKRSKITTAATTLGELKAAMANAGIDYSGMTFTEGISKIQLLDDATQLPQNVMYKGQATNNLVILLTNTKKNIASGGESRQEAYQYIKEHNLQDIVKREFGRNFTQVPTDNLWALIESVPADEDIDDQDEYEEEYEEDEEEVTVSTGSVAAAQITSLVKTLAAGGVLAQEDVMLIANQMIAMADFMKNVCPQEPVSTSDGNITDSDIDCMIDALNV